MSLQSKMWLWINQIKIRQATNNYESQRLAGHSFLFEKVVLTACLCLRTRSGNFIVNTGSLKRKSVSYLLYIFSINNCAQYAVDT